MGMLINIAKMANVFIIHVLSIDICWANKPQEICEFFFLDLLALCFPVFQKMYLQYLIVIMNIKSIAQAIWINLATTGFTFLEMNPKDAQSDKFKIIHNGIPYLGEHSWWLCWIFFLGFPQFTKYDVWPVFFWFINNQLLLDVIWKINQQQCACYQLRNISKTGERMETLILIRLMFTYYKLI